MDLKIKNIAGKKGWLARLSLLLRDALVLEPGAWDVRERRFELGLERICYEHPTASGGGVWEYPGVSCRLTVAPVSSFGNEVEEDGDDFGDGEGLLSLELDGGGDGSDCSNGSGDSGVLRVVTRRGVCRLALGSAAWLEIFDVAEPSHRRVTRDHGGSPIDPAEMQRLVTARVI